MKKTKLLTSIAALALVFSLGACETGDVIINVGDVDIGGGSSSDTEDTETSEPSESTPGTEPEEPGESSSSSTTTPEEPTVTYTYSIEVENAEALKSLTFDGALAEQTGVELSIKLVTTSSTGEETKETATADDVTFTGYDNTKIVISGLTVTPVSYGETSIKISWGNYADTTVNVLISDVTTYGPTSWAEVITNTSDYDEITALLGATLDEILPFYYETQGNPQYYKPSDTAQFFKLEYYPAPSGLSDTWFALLGEDGWVQTGHTNNGWEDATTYEKDGYTVKITLDGLSYWDLYLYPPEQEPVGPTTWAELIDNDYDLNTAYELLGANLDDILPFYYEEQGYVSALANSSSFRLTYYNPSSTLTSAWTEVLVDDGWTQGETTSRNSGFTTVIPFEKDGYTIEISYTSLGDWQLDLFPPVAEPESPSTWAEFITSGYDLGVIAQAFGDVALDDILPFYLPDSADGYQTYYVSATESASYFRLYYYTFSPSGITATWGAALLGFGYTLESSGTNNYGGTTYVYTWNGYEVDIITTPFGDWDLYLYPPVAEGNDDDEIIAAILGSASTIFDELSGNMSEWEAIHASIVTMDFEDPTYEWWDLTQERDAKAYGRYKFYDPSVALASQTMYSYSYHFGSEVYTANINKNSEVISTSVKTNGTSIDDYLEDYDGVLYYATQEGATGELTTTAEGYKLVAEVTEGSGRYATTYTYTYYADEYCHLTSATSASGDEDDGIFLRLEESSVDTINGYLEEAQDYIEGNWPVSGASVQFDLTYGGVSESLPAGSTLWVALGSEEPVVLDSSTFRISLGITTPGKYTYTLYLTADSAFEDPILVASGQYSVTTENSGNIIHIAIELETSLEDLLNPGDPEKEIVDAILTEAASYADNWGYVPDFQSGYYIESTGGYSTNEWYVTNVNGNCYGILISDDGVYYLDGEGYQYLIAEDGTLGEAETAWYSYDNVIYRNEAVEFAYDLLGGSYEYTYSLTETSSGLYSLTVTFEDSGCEYHLYYIASISGDEVTLIGSGHGEYYDGDVDIFEYTQEISAEEVEAKISEYVSSEESEEPWVEDERSDEELAKLIISEVGKLSSESPEGYYEAYNEIDAAYMYEWCYGQRIFYVANDSGNSYGVFYEDTDDDSDYEGTYYYQDGVEYKVGGETSTGGFADYEQVIYEGMPLDAAAYIDLDDTDSYSYEFTRLGNGQYLLEVREDWGYDSFAYYCYLVTIDGDDVTLLGYGNGEVYDEDPDVFRFIYILDRADVEARMTDFDPANWA